MAERVQYLLPCKQRKKHHSLPSPANRASSRSGSASACSPSTTTALKILVSLVAVDQAHKQGLGNPDLPLVVAAFLTPFLLFSGVAGRLADSVSKSALLRWMNAAEVVAMAAGTLAMASQQLEAMLAVVFLMGLHSTFYGPARAGLTPELVGLETLAGANGLLDMGSYFSIVLGTLAGTLLFANLGDHYWQAGLLLTTLAAIGFLVTLRLPRGLAAAPRGQARLLDGLRHLAQDRPLSRAVAGIASFWFLGGLMQMLVLLLARKPSTSQTPPPASSSPHSLSASGSAAPSPVASPLAASNSVSSPSAASASSSASSP